MSRNFGVTSREALGGNKRPPGSHYAHDTQRDSNVLYLPGRVSCSGSNSQGSRPALSIIEGIAARVFGTLCLLSPFVIFGVSYLVIKAF